MYFNVPHRQQLLLSKSMRKLGESSFLQLSTAETANWIIQIDALLNS
jgi:hypothetical protein